MFCDARRGDIWYADGSMGPKNMDSHVCYGDRPVIVVSVNAANASSPTVTVIPITSSPKKIELGTLMPGHIPLDAENGLNRRSVALVEQITTLDRSSLTRWIGELPAEDMKLIEAMIRQQLGL